MADEIVTPASLIRQQRHDAQMEQWTFDATGDDLDAAHGAQKILRRIGHSDLADALASTDPITRTRAIAEGLHRGLPPSQVGVVARAAALVQFEEQFEAAMELAYAGKTSRADAFREIKRLGDEARSQSRSAGRDR